MKKQSLIKGTFILGLAGIFAKFLGIFFRWPLIMLIGDEGIGYYQMSYPLYMFFIATASGLPVAISKMVAEKNAVGDKQGVVSVLKKALLLMLIMGGVFTFFINCFSGKIVNLLNWDSKAYFSLIAIGFAPLFISIVSAFRGFFQGLQNMNPTAVSQILEQIGRVVIGVTLAYIFLPKGIEYSAGGAAFGAVAGAIIAGIYLLIKYLKIRQEFKFKASQNESKLIFKLLYIAVPISIGATVSSIMSLLDSIIVPQKLLIAGFSYKEAASLYGQLTGKAFVLINVPLTLSIALCASLVPIISEAFILNRRQELLNKLQLAMKISMIIAIPSFFGIFFMAKPILNFIFPGHGEGYLILKYLSISIPFIVIAQTSTAVLQGIGNYISPVINLFIGCIMKVILTFILVPIPEFNVYGAIIGTIFGYAAAAMLNIYVMNKNINVKLKIYDILIKPAYASVIMIIIVVFAYTNVYNITVSNNISCFVSVSIGIIIYVLLIFLFGIISYDQIKRRLGRKKI